MTKKEEFLQRIKQIEKSDFQKVVSKQITLEKMAKKYNMDVKTLKQKIENLSSNDIEWNMLFSEYYGKRNDYNGYDFKVEMIQMLEEDISQTQMADIIGIPRDNASPLAKDTPTNRLPISPGPLVKAMADNCSCVIPAFFKAWSTTGTIFC